MSELDLDAIEALCAAANIDELIEMHTFKENDYQTSIFYSKECDERIIIGEYGARQHSPAYDLAQFFAASPRIIPALVARVRELEGERSKVTMWTIQRVLELEEEAVGLRADLAEAVSRLDEMGAR